MKITMVGAGSYGWGPLVVGNILRNEQLDSSEVTLYDLDPEALDMGFRLANRYRERTDSSTTFTQTTDRAAALEGADFVVVAITTGGLRAMQVDLEVPEKYGIFQTVGDTVGPGGAVRTLRNVPVFVELAWAMEEHCPGAWMLNCSNPLSALTRAVNRETSIRALGLCHGVHGTVRLFAEFFGMTLEDCAFVNTGIDHCAWLTELQIGGRGAGEMLLERGVERWLALPPAEAAKDEIFGALSTIRCGLMLWRTFGALPGIGDRHLVEFLPGFLDGMDSITRHGLKRTTIADRETSRKEGRERLEKGLAGDEAPPAHSDDVAGWMAALSGGPSAKDNLNAPNKGQICQLPSECIVETRGVIDGTGIHPLVSPMPPAIEALVRPHVLRQELLVEAALEGDFDKALTALASDPLVGCADRARPMLGEMIEGTREWLPQFA